MNKFIFNFLFLVILTSCSTKNEFRNFSGKKIYLKYKDMAVLDTTDFILINNINFKHSSISNEWEKLTVYPSANPQSFNATIPASKSVKVSAIHINGSEEHINLYQIVATLALKLEKNGYIIHDKKRLSILGELTFSKSDSSDLNVVVSKDYPAVIKSIR